MYGLLLESVMHFGQCEYGEDIWERILEHAGCKTTVFSTHLQYDDNILITLASSCSAIVGKGDKEDHLMFFGRCFVRFFSNYGYDKLIRVTGRHFCEFLSEVDNLHSQMRFSFPRMRSPSMVLRSVDADGACLQYRSSRFGFTHYLVGQLLQIARDLYNMTLLVSVKEEVIKDDTIAVTFRLDFDNREFLQDQLAKRTEIQRVELPQITLQKLVRLFSLSLSNLPSPPTSFLLQSSFSYILLPHDLISPLFHVPFPS
ncbi:soluble guanylate cyclase 89Da-like [Oratosquilla oratoria]|uniref:soluble guanylate cyclase 89Da-like n=1 Tax=Oratosquilla oratoria TaxID=337810 RepID=UPI003F774CDA